MTGVQACALPIYDTASTPSSTQSALGPSQADIRSALNQIAAETKAVGTHLGIQAVSPAVTVDTFITKGTSVEGATAKVLTTATVTYVPALNKIDYEIQKGKGFKIGSEQGSTTLQFLPQPTNLLDVNLYFRKYDTGWRLERFD